MGVELVRIVSGGQTGADRAGLDWAISRAIPHGGWCPRGRAVLDQAFAEAIRSGLASSEAGRSDG
jgi:hypothetical protein